MPFSRAILIALVLAVVPQLVCADYLEIRRAVTLKAEPHRDASILERLEPPQLVSLIEDGQTNGYYHAATEHQSGWVYRTFVRRHTGALPGSEDGPQGLTTGPWSASDGLVLRGAIVTMNEAMEVIADGQLVILDGLIHSILRPGDSLPPGASSAAIIETDGWIFPGLIDSHNHTAYNVLPIYDVPQKYDNRYQWSGPKSYSQHVNYPKKLLTTGAYFDLVAEVIKYAEVKAMVGGVTSIQGSPDRVATRSWVRNIEHTNFGRDRIRQRGLTVSDARWQATVPDGLLAQMEAGEVDAWLVHLAEGIDDESREEFALLERLGLIRHETVFIHGTALTRSHFDRMAGAGVKLIWSPLSNLLLYGETTNIPAALEAGVLVSLGTDWSPSGSKNLLGELKIADQIDARRFGNVISDAELVQMVTSNPALALGIDDMVGQLAEGLVADVILVDKVHGDPYRSLINSTERDIALVVIGGEPFYGDEAIMAALKPGDFERLDAGGISKGLDLTDPRVPDGEQRFAEVSAALESAMNFDLEAMWDTFGEDLSYAEFQAFVADKFDDGIIAKRLDPIYPFGDAYYFEAIRSSTNADLAFDVATFYGSPPQLDARILAFVNRSSTTFSVLDDDVRLDRRAARNIIAHRDGPDGEAGTADDDLFETIDELDAIKYVGNRTLDKLEAFVAAE